MLCFDKSGKFLFKLNRKGRGPEEYEYLSDYDINAKNLIMVVSSAKEIMLYQQNKEGFNFTNKINLTYSPQIINFTGK
jgi:hypothetical protein